MVIVSPSYTLITNPIAIGGTNGIQSFHSIGLSTVFNHSLASYNEFVSKIPNLLRGDSPSVILTQMSSKFISICGGIIAGILDL
jgi:hypothetical protein